MRKPPGERKRDYQEVEHALGNRAPSASRESPHKDVTRQQAAASASFNNNPEYRSFRMRTLYEGIDDALAGDA
jgi:hypothetical protein